MQLIAELLQKTHQFFIEKKIPEARYHAERLLAESLNTDRISIYLNLDKVADDHLVANYRKRIQVYLQNTNHTVTILSYLRDLKNIFLENKIPEAELHAEEFLAHVLHINRVELKVITDRNLETEEIEHLNRYKKRRLNREPLQYILGYTEFYGYPIRLNKNVLIPRSETEILVEKVLELIPKNSNMTVLDIGTGSGCIAIALKKNRPDLQLTALDFSEQALLLAEKNAGKNSVQINFLQLDFLNANNWSHLSQFDLIISNPPYVTKLELNKLAMELTFEPSAALTDFADGLTFYRSIVKFAEEHLNENGILALEIGFNQAKAIDHLLTGKKNQVIKDYNQLDRIIISQF